MHNIKMTVEICEVMTVLRRLAIALAVVAIAFPVVLRADTLTDPQYYIGNGYGNSCATGCSGEPNVISPNALDMYIPSSNDANAPSLLILGIPDYFGSAPPSISEVDRLSSSGSVLSSTNSSVSLTTFTAGLGGPTTGLLDTGALGWDTSTGQVSQKYTSGASTDVYSFIGVVPPTNSSNNVTNWFGSTEATMFGSTPSYFGIYVYEINSPLQGGQYFDVTFSGSGLPAGTIAIGYALSSQHTFSTPWTVAGDSDGHKVPEPGTMGLLLLGLGLLAVPYLLRQRFAFAD